MLLENNLLPFCFVFTEIKAPRMCKMSQKLCRIGDKQDVNFTFAVYSRKRRVDWRTLAKTLFKSFLSALSFFQAGNEPRAFFGLFIYLWEKKKKYLKKEVSWKYKSILAAVMMDTVDPS